MTDYVLTACVERIPEVCSGLPFFKGARLMVRAIVARLNDGDTVEALVKDYPSVSREAFETVDRLAEDVFGELARRPALHTRYSRGPREADVIATARDVMPPDPALAALENATDGGEPFERGIADLRAELGQKPARTARTERAVTDLPIREHDLANCCRVLLRSIDVPLKEGIIATCRECGTRTIFHDGAWERLRPEKR